MQNLIHLVMLAKQCIVRYIYRSIGEMSVEEMENISDSLEVTKKIILTKTQKKMLLTTTNVTAMPLRYCAMMLTATKLFSGSLSLKKKNRKEKNK